MQTCQRFFALASCARERSRPRRDPCLGEFSYFLENYANYQARCRDNECFTSCTTLFRRPKKSRLERYFVSTRESEKKTEREWMAHGPLVAETRQHGLPAPEEIDLSAIPQLAGPHSFLTKHVRFMGQIETDENTTIDRWPSTVMSALEI